MSVTLHLGDCLEVMRSIEKQSVSAIITSPPYNVGKEYESDKDTLDYEYLLRRFIALSSNVLDGGGYLAINISDRLVSSELREGINPSFPVIDDEARRRGLILYDRRIWVKDPAWMNNQWHSSSIKSVDEFEYVWIYRKQGNSKRLYKITSYIRDARDKAGKTNKDIDTFMGFNGMAGHWTSSKSQPEAPTVEQWQKLKVFLGVNGNIDREIQEEEKSIRSKLSNDEWTNWGSRGVWFIRSVRRNDDHPAKFPEELPARLIRLLTNEGDIVLDPFLGSGTTGLAAVKLSRDFAGIEKDPKYYAIASQRINETQMELLNA